MKNVILFSSLLFSLPASLSLAQETQKRREIFQTTTHCGDSMDCAQSEKTPDCKLTLYYEDNQLKWLDVFGLGENAAGSKGFFGLANYEDPHSLPNGPQVKSNEVTVKGSSVYAKLVAASLRWDVYKQITHFQIDGLSPESVRSVRANFELRIAGILSDWIQIRCSNLTRVQP
jgi:hypothetical protein